LKERFLKSALGKRIPDEETRKKRLEQALYIK